MALPSRNPDDALVVLFKHESFENEAKSLAEGRPIHDDLEVVEIRMPGSKDVKVAPATSLWPHWLTDPYTRKEHQITYAERFAHQYQQFKAHAAQTKSGTPLSYLLTLTEGRRAELRAQNVYTVEQLAIIEGQELKNLGPYGRDMKNQAEEFIAEAKTGAPNMQMAAELEALKARNAVLEEDHKRKAIVDPPTTEAPDDFDDMTSEQLREYITTHTGIAPTGALSPKTLKHMAKGIKPSKAA